MPTVLNGVSTLPAPSMATSPAPILCDFMVSWTIASVACCVMSPCTRSILTPAPSGADRYGYADFGPCYTPITNWNSKSEVQNCELLDLADLNTADPEVRRKIAKYMNSVIDLGVAVTT